MGRRATRSRARRASTDRMPDRESSPRRGRRRQRTHRHRKPGIPRASLRPRTPSLYWRTVRSRGRLLDRSSLECDRGSNPTPGPKVLCPDLQDARDVRPYPALSALPWCSSGTSRRTSQCDGTPKRCSRNASRGARSTRTSTAAVGTRSAGSTSFVDAQGRRDVHPAQFAQCDRPRASTYRALATAGA